MTTIILYTDNALPPDFFDLMQRWLLWAAQGKPIVVVSQKPIYTRYGAGDLHSSGGSISGGVESEFFDTGELPDDQWCQFGPMGLNIVVGEIGRSHLSLYRQI